MLRKSQLYISHSELCSPQRTKSVVHVLLAGDRDYAPCLLESLSNKCFLAFPSGELIDLTLSALSTASSVTTLLVVGPELLARRVPKTIRGTRTWFLQQQESFSANVHAALRWIQQNRPESVAIFVTNDAPLLTSAEIDSFASRVRCQDADINVAVSRISPKTLDDPLVGQYTRSIVSLSDGLYMLSNQASLSIHAIDLVEIIQALFNLRKQSQLGTKIRTFYFVLSRWGNIRVVARWLRVALVKRAWMLLPRSKVLARASIPLRDVELTLGALLGPIFRVRINEIPEALGCFDADTPQQLRELRKVIATYVEQMPTQKVSNG